MRKNIVIVLIGWALVTLMFTLSFGQQYDVRGYWVGNAQGVVFGAEGSVMITHQKGDEIQGVVEGGNFLGKAKFGINGKIQGNYIYGNKEGNTFQGYIYPDGTIRGVCRAVTGDKFDVFLKRPQQYWGNQQTGYPQYGMWQYQ